MSKFKKKDDFENFDKDYQLLPFNFLRINKKILLTNLVGEFYFTNEDTLKKLIDGKLLNTSEEYLDLRSLHFLYDAKT